MARIMHTDNFGGDYPNEKFVTELPRLPEPVLEEICHLINRATGEMATRYYKVVPDDYKLQPGFEP